MNDDSLNDPQLQSFEARLAGMGPQVSSRQKEHLLYQCAFAAGRSAAETAGKSAVRRIHYWQGIAAVLVVLQLGTGFALTRFVSSPRESAIVGSVAHQEVTAPHPQARSDDVATAVAQGPIVALNAWQAPPSDSSSITADLERFRQTDPGLRSMAVGTFARRFLLP